jgi:hypothetical protein
MRRPSNNTLLVGLFITFMASFLHAGPFDVWRWRDPFPLGDGAQAITFGDGLFMAIRDNNAFTSRDGINWILYERGERGGFGQTDFCYGNGVFAAVGNGIAASRDGITWNYRRFTNQLSSVLLRGIAFGNGTFVAVGDRGTIVTSTDGSSWALQSAGTNSPFYSVAYGKELFLANTPTEMFSSRDGTNWVVASSRSSFGSKMRFGNGLFLMFSPDEQGLLTSSNGVDWAQNLSVTFNIDDLVFAQEKWVAVGGFYGGGSFSFTSSDGLNWVTNGPNREYFREITFGAGKFVAVGDNIQTSEDGINWTNRSQLRSLNVQAFAYGMGRFVAVGSGSTAIVSFPPSTSTAPTKAVINSPPAGTYWLNDVIYANQMFVTVGGGARGVVFTSTNGINWQRRVLLAAATSLSSVAYGNVGLL